MPLPPKLLPLLATTMLLLAGHSAMAQAVYRIVGPDGKVTFSDRPPPPSSPAKASVDTRAEAAANSAGTGNVLPYALQQVARQYPVTLYTSKDCAPCNSARNLLNSRGVPYSERTVSSNEDNDALQRISNDNALPFGTIGGQQLKGFSDLEWTQYLDAAGYPKTSQLPTNYRRPAATPLVAVKAPEQAAPAAAPQANAPQAPPQDPQPRNAPSPSNPTGIQF
ncbi:glutaredoxin family protein [Variovorax sp. HJSM1_2]|uniref:glutaredoxin family protein n=1 Tax=Variovorax sp. HJSM1_2 TaxID=3366263 RepID=UPI003BECC539